MLEYLTPIEWEVLNRYYNNPYFDKMVRASSRPTLAIGDTQAFYLDVSGEVHMYGHYMQDKSSSYHSTTLVPFSVRSMIVRESHIFLIDEEGSLYSLRKRRVGYITKLIPTPCAIRSVMSYSDGMYVIGEDKKLYHNDNSSFELVDIPESVISVVSGVNQVLVLTVSGRVYGYGGNHCGQLGLGSSPGSSTFTLVPIPELVMSIAMGRFYSVVVAISGRVYGCGSNYCGQLGLGTRNNHLTFTHIPIPVPIISVSLGYSHTCFLSREGKLYACGFNSSGQLGTGNTNDLLVPIPIARHSNFIEVKAGYFSTFAICTNGKLYACGSNHNRILGLKSTKDSLFFAPIV